LHSIFQEIAAYSQPKNKKRLFQKQIFSVFETALFHTEKLVEMRGIDKSAFGSYMHPSASPSRY